VNAIEVRNVHKVYRRYGRRTQFGTLKSALLSRGRQWNSTEATTFEALRGVSFDVAEGKTVGIVGRNGSGKSTMLKLIAGIGKPTSGEVHVHGRVSALIELGAGFHPEISGRDNVFINGMMLGLSKRDVAKRFDDIVAFADMHDFIDAPVKTYSSGMYMRLGFSVAINVDPEVLLVDEVLAVGDEAFTHKCLDKFADLKRRGKTVLLVTHMLDLVTRFCDEALWLDHGITRAQGDPKRVIDAYRLDVAVEENRTLSSRAAHDSAASHESPTDMGTAREGRWGTREAEILTVEFLRRDGAAARVFESGESVEIRLHVRAHRRLTDFVFGVGIFSADGVCCYGTNTDIEGAQPGEFSGDADVGFHLESLALIEGSYKIDVAVHRRDGTPYDYHRQLHTIRIASHVKDTGLFRPPHRWTFSSGIRMTGL
jgi:ABC-type polysaccharide/polyol phosphate transport system ATPase subunit